MTISVVIADDHPLQRAGFRMVLDSQDDIEVVGEAGDGAQALALVRRSRTDVVLMDIQMPRVNGIVAAERIASDEQVLALGGSPQIILLTAVDLDDHVPAAAAAGAYTVLYKDVPPESLLDAIRSAASSRADEHPTDEQPADVQPTAVQPTAVQPTAVQPTAVQPVDFVPAQKRDGEE